VKNYHKIVKTAERNNMRLAATTAPTTLLGWVFLYQLEKMGILDKSTLQTWN
jgi:hypothetical protein